MGQDKARLYNLKIGMGQDRMGHGFMKAMGWNRTGWVVEPCLVLSCPVTYGIL